MTFRRYTYLGMIMIALGIVIQYEYETEYGSMGILLMAAGGLLFLIGFLRRRR